jgi:hypothetical protein
MDYGHGVRRQLSMEDLDEGTDRTMIVLRGDASHTLTSFGGAVSFPVRIRLGLASMRTRQKLSSFAANFEGRRVIAINLLWRFVCPFRTSLI